MAGRICPACQNHVDTPPAPPTPQEVADAAYGDAAARMRDGADPFEVRRRLTDRGIDAAQASQVVGDLREAQAEANREAGRRAMLSGALWCIGGIVVTAMTYQMAANGGGKYVIAWGAIVFGVIQFFRGLSLSLEG